MNETPRNKLLSILALASALAIPALLPQSAHGMYDPKHGRWLQRDPIGYVDGANLYQYGHSNACILVDPYGLRDMTAEEKKIEQKLAELGKDAAARGDKEFVAALQAVVQDWREWIASASDEKDPVNLTIADMAFRIWMNAPKSYLKVAGDGPWKGKDKCNKYVADVLAKANVNALIIHRFPLDSRVPLAREWGDPDPIGGFRVIWEVRWYAQSEKERIAGDMKRHEPYFEEKQRLQLVTTGKVLKAERGLRPPVLGDIIVFGEPSFHVGIYLGRDIYITASDTNLFGQLGVIIKGVPSANRVLYRSPPGSVLTTMPSQESD